MYFPLVIHLYLFCFWLGNACFFSCQAKQGVMFILIVMFLYRVLLLMDGLINKLIAGFCRKIKVPSFFQHMMALKSLKEKERGRMNEKKHRIPGLHPVVFLIVIDRLSSFPWKIQGRNSIVVVRILTNSFFNF